MAEEISGTFTATGESSAVRGRACDVSISGSFTATVKIQRFIGGNWVDWASKTAAYEGMEEGASPATEWRLSCSAYTTGTVTYALVASNL